MVLSQQYIPQGVLREVVPYISYLKGPASGVAFQRMYQVIVINLGSNFSAESLYDGTVPSEEWKASVWLNGIQENSMLIHNSGTAEMYSILIKPGMLPFLSPLPAHETNEQSIEAMHWTSAEIYTLREQLLTCTSVQQGFLLIENYLYAILRQQNWAKADKIKWLGNAIHSLSVAEICRQGGFTRKKLLQESSLYFGCSVKKLQGIIRFNQTLAAIAQGTYKSLSSLHTYYDQAHFIHDFKSRCGITPFQYKALCKQFPQLKFSPNFIPATKETFLQFSA